MVFGFGKKKKAVRVRDHDLARREISYELDALQTELKHLSEKLNFELSSGDGDRTTTLSRYPRRIIELKIRIDELERKLAVIGKK